MNILVLNSGSSSVKYQVFDMNTQTVLLKGNVSVTSTHGHAISELLLEIKNHAIIIDAIGHRVVHGGEEYRDPVLVDSHVKQVIMDYSALAPDHNPHNLKGIEECERVFNGVPQVAVFDTAFHQTIPKKNFLFSLPYELYEKERVRKYGFHGTSHNYVMKKASELLHIPLESLNCITCHLGNGASITAIKNGQSYDTSMGLTPLAGIIMGERPGDLDPGVILHLLKTLPVHEVETLLKKKCGITGISGISNDMRTLIEKEELGDERAHLAIDMYVNSIRKTIGAYYTELKRIDALIFTGGVGENSEYIRKKICDELPLLNDVSVLTIPTNEELEIALETRALLV